MIAAHISVQLNYLNKSFEGLLDDKKLTTISQLLHQRSDLKLFRKAPNKAQTISKRLEVERIKCELFELIGLHQKLLEYKAPLESVFSFTFFITFSGATVIICLQGIMITVSIQNTVKIDY